MSKRTRPVCRFPNIERWMDEHGVTRRELARRMDVTPNTVYLTLSGRTDPRFFTINAVLRVTGMDYKEAFKEADGWNGTI